MNESQHGRYVILDGMRGLAAIAVMIYHFTSHYSYETFKNAPIAVDLFFILSGFVLCFSYGEKVRSGTIGFADFMTRRVIRLYPMFIAGIAIGTIGLYFFRHFGFTTYSLHDLVASFLFNSFFLPFINDKTINLFERPFASTGGVFPSNNAMWSLFCEMFANLFFFQLVRMSIKSLRRTTLIAFALLLAVSLAISFANYDYTITTNVGWGAPNFIAGIPRVFFGFTLGILLQKILLDTAIADAMHPFPGHGIFRLIARNPLLLYAILLAVFYIPYQCKGLISVLSVGLICPAIVFVGAFATTKNRIIINASRFLGWISYPLYCLHTPIGNLIALANNQGGLSNIVPLPFAVVASLVTLMTAIVVTRFYDQPVRIWLMEKSKSLLRT